MTARRALADRRTLSLRELERLVREKSYLRPLPATPSLHQMARRRADDHQDDDTTTKRIST